MSDIQNERKHLELLQRVANRLNARLSTTTTPANNPILAKRHDDIGEVRNNSHVSLPDKLYKYMKREYAEALIRTGSIRIGTLHDFRDQERHAKGIGDTTEGKKQLSMHPEPQIVTSGSRMAAQLEAMGAIKLGPGCTINLGAGNVVSSHFDHPDVFVWCCSTELSEAAMTGLGDTNTCVEIFDVPRFFHALDSAVKAQHQVRTIGPARVTYGSRHEEWNGIDMGTNPVFLKEPSFAVQAEVRVAWSPTHSNDQLAWFILDSSNAGNFCRIIDCSAYGSA